MYPVEAPTWTIIWHPESGQGLTWGRERRFKGGQPRTFMEKMRASKYAEHAQQQYNMTLVEMEATEATSAPASSGAGPFNAPVEM